MINIHLNGKEVSVGKNKTILQVCKDENINIPTFCHDDRLKSVASCRVCVVEVENRPSLVIACTTSVAEGMKIQTHSPKVMEMRRKLLELIISDHNVDCLQCEKAGNCKLQDYAYEYDIDFKKHQGRKKEPGFVSNPFFILDQSKCILCGKCARVCSELQGNNVWSFANRGFETEINTPFGVDMVDEANCVSCGNCISVCPVGALMPKNKNKFRTWELEKTQTTCPYCGVGCQMYLLTKDDKIVGVEPVEDSVNNGLLCVKGKFAFDFVSHPDRLTDPLIKRNGKFEKATWEEAYNLIYEKMSAIKNTHGSEAFGFYGSAKITVEENYLLQKFARAVFGSNNVDHCARLCHATSVTALVLQVGSGAMTNSIAEIENADTIFVIGSNPHIAHPVIGSFITKAVDSGSAKVILADPREIPLSDMATVHMPHYSGTDIAVVNGMINHIIANKLYDSKFIEERTEGFDELCKAMEKYTPEYCEKISGVKADLIRKAAELYAKGPKSSIVFGMGVAQHANAVEAVWTLGNLACICGMVGKESTGINPLRGQNNVQGACDVGVLPIFYPGYQWVNKEDVREKFEKAWGVPLNKEPGLSELQMTEKIFEGVIKSLFIVASNPVIANPDSNNVKKSLDKLDFLVVADIFLTETAEHADVVLPAASFAEKLGCFTNTERRIQLTRPAINPIGNSKPDYQIMLELMDKFGYRNNLTPTSTPQEIMAEIAELVPQYAGVSYDKIQRNDTRFRGVRWPIKADEEQGLKFLHSTAFPANVGNPSGKAILKPVEYSPPQEETCDAYPMILTTGRELYQFHTITMSGKTDGIMEISPHGILEIHPTDAQKYNLANGDTVKISSRRGATTAKALVTNRIKEGVVFAPFHHTDTHINLVTNPAYDPKAFEPELKVCAVQLEKVT